MNSNIRKGNVMTLLVSAEGQRLDARVAPRFEKAAWFLMVDPRTLTVEAFHHALPHDQDGLLRRAGAEGIAGVISGRIGSLAFGLIHAQQIPVYSAEGMTVRQAIEKLNKGLLPERTEPDRRVEPPAETRRMFAPPPKSGAEARGAGSDIIGGGSGRGRHRLQQYGGRGH